MKLANKLQERVVEYCNTLSFEELRDLAVYLGAGITTSVKPKEKEQEFCEKYLGAVNYGEYLRYTALPKDKKPYFSSAFKTGSEIQELYGFVSFQVVVRSSEVLLNLSSEKVKSSKLNLKIADKNLEKAKLKEDLAKAIASSYEGDIFYKDNGWCNISDVLVKHKLIKLDDE